MTTWVAPQLLAGAFGVPVPTVLIAPWQLTARVELAHIDLSDEVDEDDETDDDTKEDIPATAGFTWVVTANDWSWSSRPIR